MTQLFILRVVVQLIKTLIRAEMRAKNVAITFAATFLLESMSNDSFTTFLPCTFGKLVCKDLIS